LSSIKLKLFATHVVETIITNNSVDEQKFLNAFEESVDGLKAAYACVRYLLLSSVRYDVTKDVFAIELQQLGFPREHSLSLGKVLDEKGAVLKEHLMKQSLSVNELKSVSCCKSDGIDCVKMELGIDNCIDGSRTITKEININKSDIPILLKELKIVKAKMEELED
jgi:COMM domain containing 4